MVRAALIRRRKFWCAPARGIVDFGGRLRPVIHAGGPAAQASGHQPGVVADPRILAFEPFGTEERQLITYSIQGRDFSRGPNGVQIPTTRAARTAVTIADLVNPAPSYFDPLGPDDVQHLVPIRWSASGGATAATRCDRGPRLSGRRLNARSLSPAPQAGCCLPDRGTRTSAEPGLRSG
jgi:hypothetical protein